MRNEHMTATAGQLDATEIDAIEDLHQATAFYTADPVVDELLDEMGWPPRTAGSAWWTPAAATAPSLAAPSNAC